MVWCVSCGQSLDIGVMYCWRCGTKVHSDLDKKINKSNTTGTSSKSSTATSSEVQSESSDTCSNVNIQLSPGALQSYVSLKRKYDFPAKVNKKSKKAARVPEFINIGVQILDKDLNIVRKAFKSALGVLSILQVTVNGSSTEEDWLQELGKMFRGDIRFSTMVPTQKDFIKPTHKLTFKDLEEYKKQKKISQLRLFVVAEGKGRKEIKKAFKGAAKNLIKTIGETECKHKEKDTALNLPEMQDTNTQKDEDCRIIEIGTENKDQDSLSMHPIDILQRQIENKRPKSQSSSVLENSLSTDTLLQKDAVIELDDERESSKDSSVQLPLDALIELDDKRESSKDSSVLLPSNIIQEESEDREQGEFEDHGLEKFKRMQNKLIERKQEATNRIKLSRYTEKKTKNITIFYEARNNIGLTFKAPLEADIGFLYDMACHLLEADVTAPAFHFASGETTFPRSFQSTLNEVPSVLQLIEEDFDPDGTLTNFDDVIF